MKNVTLSLTELAQNKCKVLTVEEAKTLKGGCGCDKRRPVWGN